MSTLTNWIDQTRTKVVEIEAERDDLGRQLTAQYNVTASVRAQAGIAFKALREIGFAGVNYSDDDALAEAVDAFAVSIRRKLTLLDDANGPAPADPGRDYTWGLDPTRIGLYHAYNGATSLCGDVEAPNGVTLMYANVPEGSQACAGCEQEADPGRVVGSCQWFTTCENAAYVTISHPVLGDVPACKRCSENYTGQAAP